MGLGSFVKRLFGIKSSKPQESDMANRVHELVALIASWIEDRARPTLAGGKPVNVAHPSAWLDELRNLHTASASANDQCRAALAGAGASAEGLGKFEARFRALAELTAAPSAPVVEPAAELDPLPVVTPPTPTSTFTAPGETVVLEIDPAGGTLESSSDKALTVADEDPCAGVDAAAREHEQAIERLIAADQTKAAEIERLKADAAFRSDDCDCDDCSDRAEAHFRRLTMRINRHLAGGMD